MMGKIYSQRKSDNDDDSATMLTKPACVATGTASSISRVTSFRAEKGCSSVVQLSAAKKRGAAKEGRL